MIEEAKVYQETTAAVDPLPIQVEKPPARTSAVKEANIPALKAILDYDRMCHISRPPDSAVQNDSKPAQKESSIFGNILKRLGILEQLQSTLIQDFKVLKTEMHEFRDTHDVAMTNVEKQTQKTISKLVETIDKDFKKAMQDLEHRKALVESRLLDVAVVVESLQAQVNLS